MSADTPTSPPLPLRLVRRGACEFLEPITPDEYKSIPNREWKKMQTCGRVKWNNQRYYRSAEDYW